MINNIKGSIVALVTPFSGDHVDFVALKELVEWHIEQGTHGIVPVGTTGESPTLSHSEHEKVIECVVETVNKRVPVIPGTGSNCTREAIRLTRHAYEMGADAGLVVTPYYNKPNQEGLFRHFEALHNCCDLPLIIYNIPGRSVIDVLPETMGRMAALPRIIGVKDATGDVGRVSKQRASCGKDFIQLTGNDDVALAFNALGGVGCISVVANIAPRACALFQEAMMRGDYKEALDWQDKLYKLQFDLFAESNPCPTKFGLSLLKKCLPDVRLPLVPVTKETQAKVREAMALAGVLSEG